MLKTQPSGHLRRILAAYTDYCNELLKHLPLDKESPTFGRFTWTAGFPFDLSAADFTINIAGCSLRQEQRKKCV
jgi:hypothetical protein